MTIWNNSTQASSPHPLPGLHPLVSKTLFKRGYIDPTDAQAFLDPERYIPAPASDLPGLSTAVQRLVDVIQVGDPICVWGDFDVDGQTSTTVLVQSLRAVGARVHYHIPVRKNESHGVNTENLARVIAEGAKLVVTCDTGIGALEQVKYARSRGVEMIITDHHDLPAELPNATAVVNPKMLPEKHPLATLAGVGVAYKLAETLIAQFQPKELLADDLLDLVALGLVADLAILHGDTRYLVQKGLKKLQNTQRLGLKTIQELADITASHLTEEHIGFQIGPRLNAIGRLGDANPIVELLTTVDPVVARVEATRLESLNVERKLLCDQVYHAAEAQLRANPDLLAQPVIILAHPLWPGGIVGIVASRIVERYHKPAILMTAPPGEPIRGSARSVEGINITSAIAAQQDLLLGFGGHPMAAGLSLDPAHLPEFRRRLARTIQNMPGASGESESVLDIDAWVNISTANLELAEQLECLAPFGPGNPKLNLASSDLTIKSATKLGKNQEHVKLTVQDDAGNTNQVLWWDGGDQDLPEGKFDLAFSLRASDWRGSRRAQLELVDFRVKEESALVIKNKKLEIVDWRGNMEAALELLKNVQEPEIICWAEGDAKKQTGGKDRFHLKPANTLVVWTTPVSRSELLKALKIVHPDRVIVVAIDPALDELKTFLDRMAGLIKTTLHRKNGQTSLADLCAALAQKESAVKLGLDVIHHKGIAAVSIEPDGVVRISAAGQPDLSAAEKAIKLLGHNLEESRSFRKHFQEQTQVNLE